MKAKEHFERIGDNNGLHRVAKQLECLGEKEEAAYIYFSMGWETPLVEMLRKNGNDEKTKETVITLLKALPHGEEINWENVIIRKKQK